MNLIPQSESRPEAMSDVPGACELPLTRAVVQYRDRHEVDTPGGRIQDIGLALVLEGRYASSAEVVDLGSGDIKTLDLSHELVVVDWVYEPTLDHATELVGAGARTGDRTALERFCFRLAMQVLDRTGFSPLTRPSLLRLGFRDVCRDLDLHDGTAVRVLLDGRRVVRIHMDYEGNALLIRTPTAAVDARLEDALAAAFPGQDIRRIVPASTAAAGGYQVRFCLPPTLEELRGQMAALRGGIVRLLGRFEPGRVARLREVLETFGERDTLAQLRRDDRSEVRMEPIRATRSGAGTVH